MPEKDLFILSPALIRDSQEGTSCPPNSSLSCFFLLGVYLVYRTPAYHNGPRLLERSTMSDDELSYLSPGFDLAVLTVPRLRSILVSHDVSYPSSAKKSQLIQLVNDEILPKSKRILSARARTKRTSKGITDMPSSQEDTVNGYEDEELMPPPPVPKTPRGRKSRTTTVGLNASEDEIPTATSATSRRTPGRKSTTKHPRASDTETDTHTDTRVPAARKSRKSEAPITPSVKIEEPNLPVKRERRSDESPFTDDNPFQSGSSPPSGDRRVSTESRRKSIGTENKRRKSTSRKRQTTSPSDVASKQEDGFVPPSSSTFHVPITRLGRSPVKVEEPGEDGIPITEEFTPEEQVDWVRQQEADGRSGQEIVPARRRKVRKSSAVGRSAPWIVIFTLLTAFGGWWRKEKIEIGYCGVGKPSWSLTETKVPDWADVLQPQCEPCPQHAYCEPNFEAKCEQDFIIKPHPLSLGGVLPLPPSCEPDGEKVRKIKVVADRAVEELRERRAKHECGDLVDERGKLEPVEIREPELKKEVSKMRRKGMSDVEFDDLWRGALGEIMDRDEIVSETSG